ncbi:MAG: DUF6600 domain-containing protein [Acidobacteriaceae bacterium]
MNARRFNCAIPAFLAMLGSIVLVSSAFAQMATSQPEPDPQDQGAGAQQRQRIVRLSYVQGSVRILQGDSTEFSQAKQNMPLVEGTRVDTGDDGRAELEFEDGSLVRLAPDSSVTLDQLVRQEGVYISAVHLVSGLTYLELRASRRYSFLITYADGEFSPVQNSTVRVNLDLQPADLAVLDGDIRVDKPDAYNVEVRQGESLQSDVADPSRYFLSQTIAQDSWDAWNDDRDQALLAQAADTTSARDQYAGDVGYGWSELDAYGNWYPVPGYGLMWQPSGYGDNFDPYGNGAWADYPTYGYVWVSAYPWGWTPFQCGNWSYAGGFGWGWMPNTGCGSYAGGWGNGFYGGFRGRQDGDDDHDRGHHNNVKDPPSGYRPPRRPVLIAGHEQAGSGNLTSGRPPKIIPVGREGLRPGAAPVHAGGVSPTRQPVVYQGRNIMPLRPVAKSPVIATGIRSGLVRDYPVNAGSGRPELGVLPVAASSSSGGSQSAPLPVTTTGTPIYESGGVYSTTNTFANGRLSGGSGSGGSGASEIGFSGAGSSGARTVYQPRNGVGSVERGVQQRPMPQRPVYSTPSRPNMGQGGYTPQPRPMPQRPSAPEPYRPTPAPRYNPPPLPSTPH